MKEEARQPLNNVIDVEDVLYERPAVTNLKLGVLILSTFGLIAAVYAMRYQLLYSVMPYKKLEVLQLSPIWLEEALFWHFS